MRYLAIAMLVLLAACAQQTVERGDHAFVTYSAAFTNGTVIDNGTIAVRVGSGDVIPGFDQALMGMREGQEKIVTVKARDAYGTYDAERIVTIPKEMIISREARVQREIIVPVSELIRNGVNVSRQTYETENFKYLIERVQDGMAQVYIMHPVRNPVRLPETPWPSSWQAGDSETLVYMHNATDGQVYQMNDGPYRASVNDTHIKLVSTLAKGVVLQTGPYEGRITRETSASLIADFNHPLAGHDLVFTIRVEQIEPAQPSGR